jgi:hypothetical protein
MAAYFEPFKGTGLLVVSEKGEDLSFSAMINL